MLILNTLFFLVFGIKESQAGMRTRTVGLCIPMGHGHLLCVLLTIGGFAKRNWSAETILLVVCSWYRIYIISYVLKMLSNQTEVSILLSFILWSTIPYWPVSKCIDNKLYDEIVPSLQLIHISHSSHNHPYKTWGRAIGILSSSSFINNKN